MNGRAVEPYCAGTAIAGVATLLDTKDAAFAQKGPQALSGLRLGGKQLAIDVVIHAAVGFVTGTRIRWGIPKILYPVWFI
jgi:hypothetical protein